MNFTSFALSASLAGLLAPGIAPSRAISDPIPRGPARVQGQYVEARTASVYAGACHYGSEYTTSGREALLAWHFESGTWRGVDLAGASVVLAVAGEQNLDSAAGKRRSVVYADERTPREQRDAAVDLVLARCKDLAGEVLRTELVPMTLALGPESYAVSSPGAFELAGSRLANRECCKMPYDVWYAPFVDVIEPVVGCDTSFRFESRALGPVWKRSGQNESFAGRFEWAVSPADRVAPDRSLGESSLRRASSASGAVLRN